MEKVLRGPANEPELSDAPSAKELDAGTRAGRVVEIRAAEMIVEPHEGGELLTARLRKSTRVPHSRANAVAVGDEVRFLVTSTPPAVLTEVLPRRTHLTRMRRGHEEHVICANVDAGVVVASCDKPPFKPGLVDRVLVSFASGGMEPMLALNKSDLVPRDEASAMISAYRDRGIVALRVSALSGEGTDELAEVLRGKTAVFSGQSGVGKSSLLNRLAGLDLRIADVYGRIGKGRHTTSTSTLYRLPAGGAVIDTPGIRSFALHRPTQEALCAFFSEVLEAAAECRFADCRHGGDEGCAMPAAIEEGRVRPERLASYLAILDEMER